MLRNKVFGAYASDLEFQLVHFASMPLYKEVFDADAALRACLNTVYVAESHSESRVAHTLFACPGWPSKQHGIPGVADEA